MSAAAAVYQRDVSAEGEPVVMEPSTVGGARSGSRSAKPKEAAMNAARPARPAAVTVAAVLHFAIALAFASIPVVGLLYGGNRREGGLQTAGDVRS
jgi:hypothetical protein